MLVRGLCLLFACFALTACNCGAPAVAQDGGSDAGDVDAGDVDAGEADAGDVDAGEVDAGNPDGGLTDAGTLVLTCNSCHGSLDNPAPPFDIDGGFSTTLTTVGAHQPHLRGTGWHRDVLCTDCHVVPQTVDAPGHIDPSPAEVTFGPVPTANNTTANFDGVTCSGWCHGSGLTGGLLTNPNWTQVNNTQAYCGTCHGVPPPPPHPQALIAACSGCHPNAAPGFAFSDPQKHIDGVVDVNLACDSCHGGNGNPAPPMDLLGGNATTARGVGAHRSHLGPSTWHREVPCTDCHVVPTAVEDPGHIDVAPADLTWGQVPRASGVTPAFDGGTCNTYCHGPTLTGGTVTQPTWTLVNGTQAACGACHGAPPPAPHPQVADCARCHPTMDAGIVFGDATRHIDGVLDVNLACDSCHGSNGDPAPPNDVAGNTSTTATGVGAHQSHLGPSGWHAEVTCQDCHVVPASVGEVGHIDSSPAEVTWGSTSQTRGATPDWNGTTCTGAYCHGGAFDAGMGTNTTPNWTTVNGTQAACGTCHGLPPGGTHPANTACNLCHGAVIAADGGWVDPSLHINGLVESSVQCGSCHALPPPTGAHLKHAALAAPVYGALGTAANLTNPTGYAFGCGQCHPMNSAMHMSGGNADIELANAAAPAGSLKALSPAGSYTPGGVTYTDSNGLTYTQGTCNNVYCHSVAGFATPSGVPAPGIDFGFTGYPVVYPAFTLLSQRVFTAPAWGGSNPGCGGCHGNPVRTNYVQVAAMAGQSHSWLDAQGYETGHGWNHGYTPLSCRTCHAQTVTQANATSRGSLGVSAYGAVPIASYGLHVNGRPDIDFDTVNALPYPTPRTLAAATWTAATKTCSNVSCHLNQTAVKHGNPYRYDNATECNACHQY